MELALESGHFEKASRGKGALKSRGYQLSSVLAVNPIRYRTTLPNTPEEKNQSTALKISHQTPLQVSLKYSFCQKFSLLW